MFMVSERKRGERSSGLLILFWLMLVLYCVMKSRTLILISEDNEVRMYVINVYQFHFFMHVHMYTEYMCTFDYVLYSFMV